MTVFRTLVFAFAAALIARTERAFGDPYRLRGDVLAAARAPAGLVVLGADGAPASWISAEAVVWAGAQELGSEADALVFALKMIDPQHRGELRLGRLIVGAGAIRPLHVDGGVALGRLPWDGTIELFGGLPVVPRFGERRYDWLVGGRIAQRFGELGTVGIAYLHRRDLGRLSDQEVGVDVALSPLDPLELDFRGAYDLVEYGPSEVLASAAVRLSVWRFEAYAVHRSPSRLLPATSLFAVLGDVPSNRAGLGVSWRAAPRLDVRARGGARIQGDERAEDLSLETVLRLDDTGAAAVGLELERIGGPEAGWSGVRTFVRIPLAETLALATEVELG
jgi:hypothetical protein